jgi:hypothetical protein
MAPVLHVQRWILCLTVLLTSTHLSFPRAAVHASELSSRNDAAQTTIASLGLSRESGWRRTKLEAARARLASIQTAHASHLTAIQSVIVVRGVDRHRERGQRFHDIGDHVNHI